MTPPSDRGAPLRFETLLLRRFFDGGHQTASPIAASALVAHGSDDETVDEVVQFLGEMLATAPPAVLSRFVVPDGVELREVLVTVTRKDLPRRVQVPLQLTMPVVLVPQGRDHWVFVPALAHTFYAAHGADVDALVRSEAVRVIAAQNWGAWEHRRLLPAREHQLERVALEVVRGAGAIGQGKAARQKLIDAHRRQAAELTLREVAQAVHTRVGEAPRAPLVGRDRERTELAALLGGQSRLGVLLVGEELCGKSALVDDWSAAHRNRLIFATSGAQLLAGMSGLGEWQERLEQVMSAAELLDAVIYFDNFSELLGDKPEDGGADVVSLLRRWVVDGRVRVIAELGADALDAAERRNPALLGSMSRLRVRPLDSAQTAEVLRARIGHWERSEPEKPSFHADVIAPVVELTERYLPYRAFPGKAVGFLAELRASREAERDVGGGRAVLGREQIYDAFSLISGIPSFLLRDDRALLVDEVVARLRRRVIGQDEAVRRVVETMCMVKARLQPGDKPLATFLFVGPTGVGKTEVARGLAELLFGAPDRMVRFDMSEFTDPYAAERLIRGSERDDGLLTAKVREQPFCVLLLDEIEKAHAAVFDLLLQVCGEGRLTDARGRTAWFHNCIIIMTSNLGTSHQGVGVGALGFGGSAETGGAAARAREVARYATAVREAFRPELVNRLDRVIAFHRLDRGEVEQIARLALARIAERRGLEQAGVSLEMSEAVIGALAAAGYDPAYGARALRRHLDDHLVSPVARVLARAGADAKGAAVVVRLADGEPTAPVPYPSGARLGSEVAGALRFELYRRPMASSRRALRGASGVAALRRQADALVALDRVGAVRDQIGFIESQLATATTGAAARAKQPKGEVLDARELEGLHIERHRLSSALEAVQAVQGELHAAEELALRAVFAGEDADALVDEAERLYDELRRRMFHVLVARERVRDAITLGVYDLDGGGALARWLRGLVAIAPGRGWKIELHLRSSEDSQPSAVPWPASRAWGPPRELAWAVERGLLSDGKQRSVLLRVRGRDAAVVLGLEGGLHRFRGLHPDVNPCHLLVQRLARRVTISDDEWRANALTAGRPMPPNLRSTAEREHRGDGTLWVYGEERAVELGGEPGAPRTEGSASYWAALEEIHLEHVLHHIAAGSPDEMYQSALELGEEAE